MRKGFTLFELLAVIVILGILSKVAFVLANDRYELITDVRRLTLVSDVERIIRFENDYYRSEHGYVYTNVNSNHTIRGENGWVIGTKDGYNLDPNLMIPLSKDQEYLTIAKITCANGYQGYNLRLTARIGIGQGVVQHVGTETVDYNSCTDVRVIVYNSETGV